MGLTMDDQYGNEKLWALVSEDRGKTHSSVPTTVPEFWKRERCRDVARDLDLMTYTSGEYEIRGLAWGPSGRRQWRVFRQDVELPHAVYASLREAKFRARSNARGHDRTHVA